MELAPLAVSSLIALLAYGSQILFLRIEPYALRRSETYIFNVLLGCLWVCYARACLVNPGSVPAGWRPSSDGQDKHNSSLNEDVVLRSKWCRKCEAFKPPRAHHCKKCQRCIPKMDHHCPWTINCVSHRTLAHFFRFLVYAVLAMCYLESLLFERLVIVWNKRELPSYLGPSLMQMLGLFLLTLINTITLFAVGINLLRSLWSVWNNITTIESWEIDRHKALLRRAKTMGGYLDGPNGEKIRIKKQEFPYDIGIYSNLVQALGSNPLTWLWPLASTISDDSGLDFEVNGFEDTFTSWPPPDPDRIARQPAWSVEKNGHTFLDADRSDIDRLQHFKARQLEDVKRSSDSHRLQRRRPFHERFSQEGDPLHDDGPTQGEETWRNAEGEGLGDFGLDEDAEFYDEDEVPLAQLLHQKRTTKRTNEGFAIVS